MNEVSEKNNVYEKLTPQRKQLVDMVLNNLEKGVGLWEEGWEVPGTPKSAITGKKYHGVNNFYLSILSMIKGYKDSRWLTFHQMEERDWHFKTDEEGNSLGKGAGATVEYYEMRDKLTKKPFKKSSLDGMTEDEKAEYWRDNVVPIRKYYRVFNGDLINGIPEIEELKQDPNGRNERAENLIKIWDENESKIIYGGNEAFYRISEDAIHLPMREDFFTLPDYYGVALHEIGHSTGHEKRLNRNIKNLFGSSKYAQEELRAEIASMFLEQDLEVTVDKKNIRNNSAYIQSWKEEIEDNPNVLFMSIADADKIAKYVISKESQQEAEPYTIEEGADEFGDSTYKLYMCASFGQVTAPISYAFSSREALLAEFEKLQKLPLWSDRQFKEVGMQELFSISEERAKKEEVTEEKSEVYIKPSEAIAVTATAQKQVDMTGKGVETLGKMSDRDVVERARRTKNGEKFSALYNGHSVLGTEEKDERSLMTRLAMFCGNDKEKLLRVFQSSGQFRDGKANGFYERMAEQSIKFIAWVRGNQVRTSGEAVFGKVRHGANAKS